MFNQDRRLFDEGDRGVGKSYLIKRLAKASTLNLHILGSCQHRGGRYFVALKVVYKDETISGILMPA
jgi:hypothetical protein